MFDDFFFPYERAKLWTRDMVILSLSNFFLYISLYIMLPVLPLWMVQHWYCSYAEAGGAVAVFGLTMFLPGPCNSYIIDTFKRKSVCVITLALLAGVSLLYPYVATVGLVALLRMVQGALFSVVTMTTGSTLVMLQLHADVQTLTLLLLGLEDSAWHWGWRWGFIYILIGVLLVWSMCVRHLE